MEDFDKVEAAGGFELNVCQHDVGVKRFNGGDSFFCIFRFTAHRQIGFAFESLDDASSHERVILDHKNSTLQTCCSALNFYRVHDSRLRRT